MPGSLGSTLWVFLLICLSDMSIAVAFLNPSALSPPVRGLAKACVSGRTHRGVPNVRMALESGAKVSVFGVFDRTGMVTAWDLVNSSPYKAVIQTPIGFQSGGGKLRWNIDGLAKGLPEGAELCEQALPGYIKGCILASEKPPAPDDIKQVLNALPDLKKAVLLSSVGVERRENFMIKFNPFLKIKEWAEAEETFISTCTAKGLQYTIVRTGALQGGPFYNSNPEFQQALEGQLFDLEHKAFKLSRQDNIDGSTSRDLASAGLVEALSRDEPVLSLLSAKSGSNACSVDNRMKIKLLGDGDRMRLVFTPSKRDWDTAFQQL